MRAYFVPLVVGTYRAYDCFGFRYGNGNGFGLIFRTHRTVPCVLDLCRPESLAIPYRTGWILFSGLQYRTVPIGCVFPPGLIYSTVCTVQRNATQRNAAPVPFPPKGLQSQCHRTCRRCPVLFCSVLSDGNHTMYLSIARTQYLLCCNYITKVRCGAVQSDAVESNLYIHRNKDGC